MSKFTHFIFDLDGTLLDTIHELLYNMNLTFKALGLTGNFSPEEMATFIGSGKDEQIRRAMRARNIEETYFNEINRILSGLYEQNTTERTIIFEGVSEVLNYLKAHNYPLYVATNKPESIALDVVKHFFGEHFFRVVRGDRGDGIVKPDPRFLGSLIAEIDVAREHILFVGDSTVDFLTAKNADVKCAIVPYGYDVKVFEIVDHDLIKLTKFTDILKFLEV